MTSRSLLVAVPGYPLVLQSLMPNQRLMALAGALVHQDHETAIIDLATLSAVADVYSTKLHVLSEDALRSATLPNNTLKKLRVGVQLRLADRLLADALVRLADRTGDSIVKFRPDFVVVDVSSERGWGLARRLMSAIRWRAPALPLFASGPFTELFHDTILESCAAVDGVLVADAEAAVTQLAARIHARDQWRFIPNFRYRDQPSHLFHRDFTQDLDSLPAPACSSLVYPDLSRGEKILLLPVEDARGAVFPSHGRVQECAPPLRVRSAAGIVRQMHGVKRNTGISTFHFQNPETPATVLRGIAAELVARNIGALYSRVSHVQCLDNSAASAMAVSGGQCIGIRVATGSQRLLADHYGHTYGVSEAEEAVRVTIRQGLHTTVQLTYPCPWDDEHTRAESLRFLRRTRPHAIQLELPRVLPHSRWHAMGAQFGYNRWDRWYSAWIGGDGLSRCFSALLYPPVAFSLGAGRSRGVHLAQRELLHTINRGSLACPVTPEGAMLARTSGYAGREAAFCLDLDRLLITGAVDELASVVVHYNDCAAAGRQTGFRPFSDAQLAVGN